MCNARGEECLWHGLRQGVPGLVRRTSQRASIQNRAGGLASTCLVLVWLGSDSRSIFTAQVLVHLPVLAVGLFTGLLSLSAFSRSSNMLLPQSRLAGICVQHELA